MIVAQIPFLHVQAACHNSRALAHRQQLQPFNTWRLQGQGTSIAWLFERARFAFAREPFKGFLGRASGTGFFDQRRSSTADKSGLADSVSK
ncbi:hypothetical protein [Azovibrio restrictus]|uniref:hypothetical protein n=1 Tax=Azovibrio restrictus TaxID=146938 RepID=UPI0026ED8601|nr:hypothetical protein [Azovibrio restrictus]MDD3482988.1 hypothetical protein [Azovibrio restrictus]